MKLDLLLGCEEGEAERAVVEGEGQLGQKRGKGVGSRLGGWAARAKSQKRKEGEEKFFFFLKHILKTKFKSNLNSFGNFDQTQTSHK